MVSGIRTIYPCGLNKGFSSEFCVDFRLQHKTPEEGWRVHCPKCYQYNNKDEDNSLNDKKKYSCFVFLNVKYLENVIFNRTKLLHVKK